MGENEHFKNQSFQISRNAPKNQRFSWPQHGSSAAEIARCNYKVLISPKLINSQGFYVFYNEWIHSSPQCADALFIPSIERSAYNFYPKYPALRMLDVSDANDSVSFFREIKKKGTWLYLISDEKDATNIITASREAGAFLRVYLLDEDGKIENCNLKPIKGSNVANKSNDLQIDGFCLTSEIVPLKRVIRKANRMPLKGDAVYDSHNNAIGLGDEFMSNPQSITYQTDLPKVQAKIYQSQWLSISYFEEKARKMLSKSICCEGICWPIDLLYNAEGDFIGILVPAAEGYQLKQQILSQQGLTEHFPTWNRRNLTRLASVILEKIVFLHDRNIMFGLVNPSTIFVKDEEHVYFAEMDTYQIEGFPILSYERVMQAPELQNISEGIRLYTKEEDNYEIALLVFMVLLLGKFPYNKGNNRDITESIRNMTFAFQYGKNGKEHGAKECFGSWRFAWSHLGNDLKYAFYHTFQKDGLYSFPEKRKDARFWLWKVNSLAKELETPYDMESLQLFPRTFKRYSGTKTIRCVKCGIDHPDFYFRYPDKKICNSCLGKPSNVHFECRSCKKSFYYDFGTLFKYEELVEKKSLSMPTHCPYCRSDKQKCNSCGKTVPSYRLNDNNVCYDCAKAARERISKSYYCRCGNQITLTQGQVDFYMKKFGNLPQKCDQCRAARRSGY